MNLPGLPPRELSAALSGWDITTPVANRSSCTALNNAWSKTRNLWPSPDTLGNIHHWQAVQGYVFTIIIGKGPTGCARFIIVRPHGANAVLPGEPLSNTQASNAASSAENLLSRMWRRGVGLH